MPFLVRCIACCLVLPLGLLSVDLALAQEATEEAEPVFALDGNGHLVQFERDIAPILRSKCLECHGPEDAKNDFRVDDRELMMDYLEPEDAESSTLYVDYLTIDDEDMLMPPRSHGGPLSAGELALIRIWIEEGAEWPEDFAFSDDEEQTESAAAPPAGPKSLRDRIWTAQGFLHPATVHFPIALLTVGALFVVLGWKWPAVGNQIPLACLLLGAASAVVATLMGWAFAPEQGYGSGSSGFSWDREIDVHRWSGVIVSVVSCLFALIALASLRGNKPGLTKTWKVGLLVCAAMVGAVGHQGGEMSFGADFYPRAWRILTGQTEQTAAPVESVIEPEVSEPEVSEPEVSETEA